MTPRERRLLADLAEIRELEAMENVDVAAGGSLPERYSIAVRGEGLEPGDDGQPAIRTEHRFDIYLPLGYPRQAPVIAWQTPIFHPNILAPADQGCVCIEAWHPSRGIGELCRELIEMATYRFFNLEQPLNPVAGEWVRTVGLKPGGVLRDAVATVG